jgi:hypothetical protein
MHMQTAGHEIVTFEMLHECFRDQVRSSTSAPVQVEGGGIGMMRCSREVLMTVCSLWISWSIVTNMRSFPGLRTLGVGQGFCRRLGALIKHPKGVCTV